MGGGGFCATTGLTPYGCAASNLLVRGEIPDWEDFEQVLSIGLFDGIGALRVSLDCIGAPMCGHVSVESNEHAQRVLEANFADSILVNSVDKLDDEMVLGWALRFSSASVVVLGAGPRSMPGSIRIELPTQRRIKRRKIQSFCSRRQNPLPCEEAVFLVQCPSVDGKCPING